MRHVIDGTIHLATMHICLSYFLFHITLALSGKDRFIGTGRCVKSKGFVLTINMGLVGNAQLVYGYRSVQSYMRT